MMMPSMVEEAAQRGGSRAARSERDRRRAADARAHRGRSVDRAGRRGTRRPRRAQAAMSGSWVTSTIVMPSALSRCEQRHDLVAGRCRARRSARRRGAARVVDQRAGDGDALLLAARELRRAVVAGRRARRASSAAAAPLAPLGARHAGVEQRQLARSRARVVRGSRLNCWKTKPIVAVAEPRRARRRVELARRRCPSSGRRPRSAGRGSRGGS